MCIWTDADESFSTYLVAIFLFLVIVVFLINSFQVDLVVGFIFDQLRFS